MLRGMVFDFDGVIVDSHPVHKRAWKRLLESVGVIVSEKELEFVVDGRTRDDILRHFLGELDSDQLRSYGQRKEQYFQEEAASVQTVHGLLDLLQDLKKAQMVLAVASSGSRRRIDFLLMRLDLNRHFHAVVTGDECGLPGTGRHSIIHEVTQTSPPLTVWQMQVTGWFVYRGFRIPSLYPGVQWANVR